MSVTEQIEYLTQYYKENRADFNDNFRLKMHRTLSWLKKADEEENLDFKFVSLWIAFNAAYADVLSNDIIERKVFQSFIERLCELDSERLLYGIVWDEFPGTIFTLLDTPYTFQPFWDYRNNTLDSKEWKKMFSAAKNKAKFAFEEQNTAEVLEIVFGHLYTLRNQIVHGGATMIARQTVNNCKMAAIYFRYWYLQW